MGALTNAHFELPAFSILERTTRHPRALVHRKLCGTVFARLTGEERQALDWLLAIPRLAGILAIPHRSTGSNRGTRARIA
jgi:hypothetical protein